MYQPHWDAYARTVITIAEQVKAANPAAWNELKVPGQKSRKFINLVAVAVFESGLPAGVNLKRGGPQLSIDVLAFPNETGCADATGTYTGLELRDIINGAEGPNPSIVFGDATPATIEAGVPGGWQAGSLVDPVPVPPPTPSYPYPDEPTTVKKYQDRVKATYAEAGRQFPDPNDADAFRHFTRYGYSCHEMPEPQAADKHIKELRAELGLPA